MGSGVVNLLYVKWKKKSSASNEGEKKTGQELPLVNHEALIFTQNNPVFGA